MNTIVIMTSRIGHRRERKNTMTAMDTLSEAFSWQLDSLIVGQSETKARIKPTRYVTVRIIY